MKISTDIKLNFDNVQIVPKKSNLNSRQDVNLYREFKFYHSPQTLKCIPIICANMASVAGLSMAESLNKLNYMITLHKYILNDTKSTKELNRLYQLIEKNKNIFFSIGMKDKDLNTLTKINARELKASICIDVPNGYIKDFIPFCSKVRELFPESIIMAGNVVTPELTQELIIYGKVDIVKVGIGPGSQCLTSKVTGIGYPQLSASIENSIIAHGLKSNEKRLGLICLDGGFKTTSDICKGFVGGSDFIMSGSFFAGTKQCCGEWAFRGFKKHLKHYGMSSHLAQTKHEGGQKVYRASEGRVDLIPYKGCVSTIVSEINGSLRSCGTYIGADQLKDFNKCGSFIRIS